MPVAACLDKACLHGSKPNEDQQSWHAGRCTLTVTVSTLLSFLFVIAAIGYPTSVFAAFYGHNVQIDLPHLELKL